MTKKEFFDNLYADLNDAVAYKDFNIALKNITKIEKLLEENDVELDTADLERLKAMLPYFQWVAFANLDENICAELIEKHLDIVLQFPDFDLEEIFAKKVVLLYLDDFQVNAMKTFLKAMKNSLSKIGNKPITLMGKEVEPTVANWLADYLSSVSINSFKGNLEEAKYINQSSNSSKLSSLDKHGLEQVIKVYDSMNNSVRNFESIPLTDNEEEAFKGFHLYKWLPGLGDEDIDKIKISTPFDIRRGINGVGIEAKEEKTYLNQQKFDISKNLTGEPLRPLADFTKPEAKAKQIDQKLEDLKNRLKK
jgi:hypothetical protein